MFYKVFFLPQVKRSVIITYKHGIYELHLELPNDLKLKIIRNKVKPENSQNSIK